MVLPTSWAPSLFGSQCHGIQHLLGYICLYEGYLAVKDSDGDG